MKDYIEMRKLVSEILRDAQREAKRDSCFYCGKNVTHFCNSHTVPRFVIENIADKGKVFFSTVFMGIESEELGKVIDGENGIKNAGTIHIICNECDSTIFSDYESEDALLNEPSNIMMAEIALKNILMQISKRYEEKALYNNYKIRGNIVNKEVLDDILQTDLNEYYFEFRRSKKIIEKNLKSGYKVLFCEKLPYVIPIAAQTMIAMQDDLNGRIINDVNKIMNKKDRIQYIHLCFFPLKSESIVLLFYHKDDNKYFSFERNFNRLSFAEKLEYLNYWMFKYAENYFFSKKVKYILENNKALQILAQSVNGAELYGISDFPVLKKIDVSKEDIPNFLTNEYKIH